MISIKVMLVDDHEVVRAGYRRLLESSEDIHVVGEACSGEEAYEYYPIFKPDVVVMDISMPGSGGLEAIRRMINRDKNTRILVFSVHENEVFLQRALEIGARGYITKRSASQTMIEAVRRVAQGHIFVGEDMLPYLVKQGNHENTNSFNDLSPREFEVFLLLAKGKTVNEIADMLNISSKTAGNHMTSLKNKLNVSNVVELTHLAIRNGLIDP